MKKITLNETDLLKIVKRVLNEQKNIQFDEDELELIHFIFERELKPPFRKGKTSGSDYYPYHNRDGDIIGWLTPDKYFGTETQFQKNIKYKVCQAFQFPYNTSDGLLAIRPHLKSWMEGQLNIKIHYLYP